MHEHAMTDQDGFAEYTMVRYLYYSFNGIVQLKKVERSNWINLMREKNVYPLIASRLGSKYYREHFQTMKIKGIGRILFRWIPTPVGYNYVKVRLFLSTIIRRLRYRH